VERKQKHESINWKR